MNLLPTMCSHSEKKIILHRCSRHLKRTKSLKLAIYHRSQSPLVSQSRACRVWVPNFQMIRSPNSLHNHRGSSQASQNILRPRSTQSSHIVSGLSLQRQLQRRRYSTRVFCNSKRSIYQHQGRLNSQNQDFCID